MQRRTRTTLGGVALAVLLGGTATGLAVAATHDDEPLTDGTLDQATRAALEHTGGGDVIETEVGDDGAAYGVEVRLPDGRVVEVSLNEDFTVLSTEDDDDGPAGGPAEGADDE